MIRWLVLVGRERELVELQSALAGATSGTGALVLLAGEPGIGKTSLASAVATSARELGIACSWGRCWEAGGAPAFWPWREAFEGLAIAFPDHSRTALLMDPAGKPIALLPIDAGPDAVSAELVKWVR